jgi:hypothetical protein
MADTYLNQKGAQHRAEKTKEWADARFVRYTTYNAVGVAGSGKNVSVLFPQTLYVPDGLIMGGTALSAGLATRGICGVTTPDGKGGCTKENLYLNYDGNNNYSRKVVLGAGSAGNEIANSSGAYTYSAVRGDQMVSYVTNYVPGAIKTWFDSNVHIPSIKTLNTDHSSALPVSSSEARSGSGSINLHKVSKTGKFSDLSNRGEAFLSWGGQSFAGSYGPIDSAMIADLGANRLAFMPPAGISVEYSRDSGTTWQDYGATDGQKLALTSTGVNFNIGKADSSNKATEKYMLRISLHTSDGHVYTQLNKFALYVSTNGSNGSYCTIRARTQNNYLNKVDKWDVFANKQSIAGWSGWNIINTSTLTTYGNSPANQYGEIQLIFGCTAGSTTYAGLQIQRLMGFGGVGWTTPSNRAKFGTIYSYDYNQGVAFPGTLTANGTFTSIGSTILSSVKSAGILGTDGAGKVYDNSSAYQKAGNYATKSDLTKYQPAGNYQPAGDYATKSDLGKYQPKGDYVTYDNASKDIYLGSHGIYSGARPSSGGVTMAGNGYWIKESSVGVSSAVTGGVAVSSEMTPNYVSVANGKIKLNSSGIVSDSGTFTFDGNPGSVATTDDLKNYQKKGNYVTIDTAQTITGRKTFNSPANVNGQEVATAIFKTSNGGQLIIGKEGPSSGTMLRFDQTAGTTRLQFRASGTPGAMVWSQPEKGAVLYFDLTDSKGVSHRSTLSARGGEIARTSDIGNGTITIQKNGTNVDSFTTNQSSGKTINIPITKSDVGLGNVDNTADKDKSVKHASSADDATNAFKLVSEDKKTEYDWITIHNIFDRISYLERYTKVYSVDTNTTTSNNHGTPINSKFESNVETISVEMSTNFDSYPTNQCIYADRIGDVTPNELKVGDIIVIDGYLSRYVSDKTTVSTSSSGQASVIRVKFTAINRQYLDRINGKANSSHTHTISQINNLQSALNGKQDALVSGTNIRTINGTSILGSGNISIASLLTEKEFSDIMNATSSKSSYIVMDKLLIQWGVYNGAHGDTTDWEVTYPKTFYWYPAVILQTKDTNTGSQGIPYSNGAVITSYRGGESFTFQLRRSETCPVYWIAIGGLR